MRALLHVVTVVILGSLCALSPGACGGGSGGGGAPQPTLTGVAPPSGTAAGGTPLTLTGTGFSAGGVSVVVGGNAATNVVAVDDTTVTCLTPPGTPGPAVSVTVTTAGGVATLAAAFMYLDLFDGTYHYTGFLGNWGATAGQGQWGTMTSAGLGTVTGGSIDWMTNGAPGGPAVWPPSPYTIDASRRIEWLAAGVPNVAGGISDTGDLVIASSIGAGTFPGIALLCRSEGVFDTTSLVGTYHACIFSFQAGGLDFAYWGTIHCNGAGFATHNVSANLDGGMLFVPSTTTAYTVAADGAATYTWGLITLQGGVLMGGDVALLAGSTTPGQPSMILVMIRESANASNATLDGLYNVVSITADVPPVDPIHWRSLTGTATCDGAGWLAGHGGIANEDTAPVPFGPVPAAPYNVTPDGGLVIGANVWYGAVSPDGRLAMFSGTAIAGNNTHITVMLR